MFCIIFSTALSRVCNHLRQGQRETLRRSEQDERPPPIYFIPFSRGMSQQDSEDPLRVPGQSQELHSPPRYSTAVHCGPPPAYNEVILKHISDGYNLKTSLARPGCIRSCHILILPSAAFTAKIRLLYVNLVFLSVYFSWNLSLTISPLLTQSIALLCIPSHSHLTQPWFNHKHSHNNKPGPSHCACVEAMDSLDYWTTSWTWVSWDWSL